MAETEALCRAVLAQAPKHSAARALIAAAALKKGKPDEAIQLLRSVVADDPDCFGGQFWLSVAFRTTGQFEESLAAAHVVSEKWPNLPEGQNLIALTYLEMGKDLEAEIAFREVARTQPKNPTALYNLSTVLLKQGKLSEAEQAARQSVDLKPAAALPYAHYGRVLAQIQRSADSAKMYRLAAEREISENNRLMDIACAQTEELDFEGAEATLKKVLAQFPTDPNAKVLWAKLLQALGRFDEAAECLRGILEAQPGRASTYLELSQCKKFTPADLPFIERMSEALERPRLSARDRMNLHYAIGKAYNDLERFELAMPAFIEANRLMAAHTVRGNPIRRAEQDRLTIETFTPEFFAAHGSLGNPSVVPVFVVGMVRSGTTLAEQILSSHAQIFGAGELDFWRNNSQHVFTTEKEPSPERILDLQTGYLSLIARLGQGAERVIDKSPGNYSLIGQIHTLFPNAKFIHCRRHPVDNCLSIFTTYSSAGWAEGHELSEIADSYRAYVRIMDHFRNVIPSKNLLEVRYEELVSQPETVTREMVKFCGLPWDDKCLDHAANQRVVMTPSVWQARQPVYKGSVGRWRNYEPWIKDLMPLLSEGDRSA